MGKFYYLNQIDSTNSYLLALAEEGAENGTVVIANSQTGGRGRRENKWHSPPGGLYLSYLWKKNIAAEKLEGLPARVAQAAIKTLEKECGIKAELKLPNDIYFQGKKLGGILLESRLQGENLQYLVVGIGINLNLKAEDFPAGLNATSVYLETGREFSGAALAVGLVEELETCFKRIGGVWGGKE